MSGLRTLSLGRAAAGGRGLAAIAEMPGLEEVRLHGESEVERAIASLAKLPLLAKLDVEYLKISAKTARAVKKACPPWVECVLPAQE